MSEEKFTKGDWSISDIKNENYGYSATIVSKEQMATIAELKATTTPMVDHLPNSEGFKANLALLKAAPAMYKMLKRASQDCYNVSGFAGEIDDLLDEARGK